MADADNSFEKFHRMAKCQKFLGYYIGQAVKVLEKATEEEWTAWAEQAGVNKPSLQSREIIIQLLRGKMPGAF